MSGVLASWNDLSSGKAAEEILPCCGSRTWAEGMAAQRPILDEVALLGACDSVCGTLAEADWLEAFRNHPRIGESQAKTVGPANSAAWAEEEQRRAGAASEDVKAALEEGNRAYEQRFKRVFIVCATGKSAPEILEILRQRLGNDEAVELGEAAEQQRQITHIRLKKWLTS